MLKRKIDDCDRCAFPVPDDKLYKLERNHGKKTAITAPIDHKDVTSQEMSCDEKSVSVFHSTHKPGMNCEALKVDLSSEYKITVSEVPPQFLYPQILQSKKILLPTGNIFKPFDYVDVYDALRDEDSILGVLEKFQLYFETLAKTLSEVQLKLALDCLLKFLEEIDRAKIAPFNDPEIRDMIIQKYVPSIDILVDSSDINFF